MRLEAAFVPYNAEPFLGNSQKTLLTCRCGSQNSSTDVVSSTVVSWERLTNLSKWSKGEPITFRTSDMGCRELLYDEFAEMVNFCASPVSLELRGISSTPNGSVKRVIEQITSAVWLGMTPYVSQVKYKTDSSASLPAEMLDPVHSGGGPLFSIMTYFLKHGQGSLRGNNEPVGKVNEINGRFSKEVEPYLNLETLTQEDRTELLRSVIRFLWDNVGGDKDYGSDYYFWAKYLTLWHSLGGLPFFTSENGLGHYVLTKDRYGALTSKNKVICQHKVGSSISYYNGSHTFYSCYFNRVIDGRAVQRFLDGGNGMLNSTALTYLKEGLPWQPAE